MRIIKRGKIKEPKFKVTCETCNSVIEFTNDDVNNNWQEPLIGSYGEEFEITDLELNKDNTYLIQVPILDHIPSDATQTLMKTIHKVFADKQISAIIVPVVNDKFWKIDKLKDLENANI